MELGDCEVRKKKLKDLNPAAYNPRVITDGAFHGLGGSIEKFGLMSLIIWNERTGNIVGGHQRYRYLAESGETETDVVVVDLDDDSEISLNIALNNPQMRGDFTKDIVALLMKSEAQIGNAFGDIGLDDLHNYVKRLKFDKGEKGEKDPKSEEEDPDPDESTDGEPDAVISCPRCASMWRMTDNKVIFNALEAAKQSDEVGSSED